MNKWLRASAVLTLIALGMMIWSVLRPTPLPVMLAMSVGQGIGTIAFGIYGWIVLVDLRRLRQRARRAALMEEREREVDAVAGSLTAAATAALEAAEEAARVASHAPPAAASKPPEPES